MPSKNSKKKSGYVPSGPSKAALAEREERDFHRKREDDVKILKEEWRTEFGDDWKGIQRKKFTAISMEYLVKTDDEMYVPGEIGICSYSLADGIVSGKLHAFIKPASLPLGYTADAKIHSEQRHKMPFAGLDYGLRDFNLIMAEVNKLIDKNGDGKTTAFVMAEEYKPVDSGLKYLNNFEDHRIRLICVEDLLHALCEWREKCTLNRYDAMRDINDCLSRAVYDFVPSIRCKFHDHPDIDIPHCSIATVHRIWYHTTDYLCADYQITPTAKHYPSASNKFRSIVDKATPPVHTELPQTCRSSIVDKSLPGIPHELSQIYQCSTVGKPSPLVLPKLPQICRKMPDSEKNAIDVQSINSEPYSSVIQQLTHNNREQTVAIQLPESQNSSFVLQEDSADVQLAYSAPSYLQKINSQFHGHPGVPVFYSASHLSRVVPIPPWIAPNISGFVHGRGFSMPFDRRDEPLQRSRGPNMGKNFVIPPF